MEAKTGNQQGRSQIKGPPIYSDCLPSFLLAAAFRHVDKSPPAVLPHTGDSPAPLGGSCLLYTAPYRFPSSFGPDPALEAPIPSLPPLFCKRRTCQQIARDKGAGKKYREQRGGKNLGNLRDKKEDHDLQFLRQVCLERKVPEDPGALSSLQRFTHFNPAGWEPRAPS